ncbi:MAG: ATP-dependent Clp protease adaptor ClpS [Candidatus Hydrogenedentes bacterium]|nr:ATP-dependent Clp protease adaptor ClpS [Candidatus Hydrogenedentota bacterium]
MPEYVGGPGTGTLPDSSTRDEVERPRPFKVLLHNDDYTSMEFVVEILQSVFRKGHVEAVRIMLNVHHNGVGVAGVYSAQIAESKVHEVHSRAEDHGFPLRCSIEPA